MIIYEPKGKAYEYSPLALNYFSGCDHNCYYCYVNDQKGRWNPDYNHNVVEIKIDYDRIIKSAKKYKGCEKQILLSFTGDPYCQAENGETSKILEILNNFGHKVAILTKNPEKALKDIELIKSFGNRIKIGTTLTFDNDIHSLINLIHALKCAVAFLAVHGATNGKLIRPVSRRYKATPRKIADLPSPRGAATTIPLPDSALAIAL